MTGTEAIAIITRTLEGADDATLTEAAARLAQIAQPADVTASDIANAFTSDSVLPRELTERELALIEQSKEEFRTGRTYTIDELDAFLDAAAAVRAARRSA
jgi:hypothetical protein